MFFVCICSINYWRNATYGLRRQLDLIISKLAFVIYLYNGYNNLYGIGLITGYSNLSAIIYFYYMSNKLFTSNNNNNNNNNNNWLKYHMLFHLFIGIQSYAIICYLPELVNNNNKI